jgi:drug/metabolite transporter (DMT)-like permease
MFVGEMLCFLPVIYTWLTSRQQRVDPQTDSDPDLHNKFDSPRPLRGWKILLLWIPAACDLTATTLMNVGLLYTPVSIFQMTRGALVLFVGIFSVVFLHRRLWLYQWVSLIVVMAGVGLVGYSGSLIKEVVKGVAPLLARVLGGNSLIYSAEEPELSRVLVGIFFILFAQVFTATQFVVEERIMGRYSVSPLVAVGYEGLFGTLSIFLFVPILAIPSISALSPFFDFPRGWYQMINNPAVLYSSFAICLSISLFNFFGLSVTRHVSATARSLTDTCRTLSIWIISLGLGWEKLLFPISLLQVLGFSLLVYGTFLFNNLVKPPHCLPGPYDDTPVVHLQDEEEREVLLDETATLPVDLGQSGFDVLPEGEHVIAEGDVKPPTPYQD